MFKEKTIWRVRGFTTLNWGGEDGLVFEAFTLSRTRAEEMHSRCKTEFASPHMHWEITGFCADDEDHVDSQLEDVKEIITPSLLDEWDHEH